MTDDSTQLVAELHRTMLAVADAPAQHAEPGACTQLAGHDDAVVVARAVLTILLEATTDLYYRAESNIDLPGWNEAFVLLDAAVQLATEWRDEQWPSSSSS